MKISSRLKAQGSKQQDGDQGFFKPSASSLEHELQVPAHSFKRRNGQALLELAIFGSMLILVLGVLVQYGLNFDFHQQADMEAYREALASAAQSGQDQMPISVNHAIMRDRHIPDPSNPFGQGSMVPIIGFAVSPPRTNFLNHVPDHNQFNELPRAVIEVEGRQVDCDPSRHAGCVTSGFRAEQQVLKSSLPKSNEVYGDANVCTFEDGQDGEPPACGATINDCPNPTFESTPGGRPHPAPCPAQTENIFIVDPMEGELINYEAAVRQCRMIVDPAYCTKECQIGLQPGRSDDCAEVCVGEMNPPNQTSRSYDAQRGGAWYCADWQQGTPPTFPRLEVMFAGRQGPGGAIRTMGLQPTSTRTSQKNDTLRIEEAQGGFTSTTVHSRTEQIGQKVIFRKIDDTSGETQEHPIIEPSRDDHEQTEIWTTPKER